MTEKAVSILKNTVLELRKANIDEATSAEPNDLEIKSNQRAIVYISMLLMEYDFEKNPL